jgi:hypothetical protein
MDDSIASTARLIEQYLALRPLAADTVEGIRLWWIDWPVSPESLEVTLAALEKLEREGVVVRVAVGTREIWRAAPKRS